jgi:hypothetical protein
LDFRLQWLVVSSAYKNGTNDGTSGSTFEKIGANQAKMDANLMEIKAEIRASQEHLKEEMRTSQELLTEEMLPKMEAKQERLNT